jgi:hypothetical protein
MPETAEMRGFMKMAVAMSLPGSPILGEIRQILGADFHGRRELLGIALFAPRASDQIASGRSL